MSNYINGVTERDLYILSAAATGAAINRASSAEELKNYLLFGGGIMALPLAFKTGKAVIWDLPVWTYKNWGNYGPALRNTYKNTIGQTTIFAANRAPLKGKFWDTVNNNYLQGELKRIKTPAFDLTKPQDVKKADIYKDVTKLTNEAKTLKGKELAAKIDEIKAAQTKAKIAENNAKAAGEITRNTKLGKAASWVKTKTGVRALENKVLEGTLSSNKAVKIISKGAKAGGAMALISAGLEVPTVVKTYKELGGKKGTKQLGKSAVKVAADTAGFAVGAKLGGIAGAKLGATIGTCIGGPIGTAVGGAVGAIIGIAGGILGSWLAGKAARAVVGKDELEIAQEEQTKQLAEAAKDNPELQAELAINASENLQTGNVASEEDAEAIAQSVDKVAASLTGAETTAVAAPSTNTTTATGTTTAAATKNTLEPDAGLNALFALADGKISTGYTNNPFGWSSNMNTVFNPFMNNYFGQFMPIFGSNTAFNPFMNNYFNPFNYGNLAA